MRQHCKFICQGSKLPPTMWIPKIFQQILKTKQGCSSNCSSGFPGCIRAQGFKQTDINVENESLPVPRVGHSNPGGCTTSWYCRDWTCYFGVGWRNQSSTWMLLALFSPAALSLQHSLGEDNGLAVRAPKIAKMGLQNKSIPQNIPKKMQWQNGCWDFLDDNEVQLKRNIILAWGLYSDLWVIVKIRFHPSSSRPGAIHYKQKKGCVSSSLILAHELLSSYNGILFKLTGPDCSTGQLDKCLSKIFAANQIPS